MPKAPNKIRAIELEDYGRKDFTDHARIVLMICEVFFDAKTALLRHKINNTGVSGFDSGSADKEFHGKEVFQPVLEYVYYPLERCPEIYRYIFSVFYVPTVGEIFYPGRSQI